MAANAGMWKQPLMGDEAIGTERMKVTDADDSQCKDHR